MKENYDFSEAVKNPYAKRLKKQLTIRLDTDTIGYFQELSRELGVPYQTLINMYLRDCALARRRPEWAAGPGERQESPAGNKKSDRPRGNTTARKNR